MLNFLKKHWFIIIILFLSLIRFLFTYKLPTFYLSSSIYDDALMINYYDSLVAGNYLGTFDNKTLIKGPIFSILLFLFKIYKINFSCGLTILYIFSSLFFVLSLKNIIKNKRILIIIYLVLLFNPVTYSQDLFQRLYRNSISIIELLFCLGTIIRVLFSKDKKIINYILFGISLSFLFLTREDNLWLYPVLIFVFIYNIVKNHKLKNIIYNLTPFIILILSLNIISFINYKHYGIYTYNEIQKSEFHNTYKKILQIKDDEKIGKVSIPKSTIYKLIDKTETFNLTKEEVDSYYKRMSDSNGEIYNGNMIWYLRDFIYSKNRFKSGKESEEYYKKLGEEIDKLFANGTFKKEFVMPSNSLAVPSLNDLKKIPSYLIHTIVYTTTFEDIKTMPETLAQERKYFYKASIDSYIFDYLDYHHTVNIVEKNELKYEIIRIIYKYLTIILSIISLIIYLKNILKFNEISILSHILLVCYCLLIGGIVYTHITSFHAIRPLYLGNVYILQSIFIMINLSRIDYKKIINKLKKSN